jgi:2-C-methyl-D-erythritol 2,4-cyclodiphosphate synthase
MIRIGQGFDIHRFAPGRRLVLGGIEIPGADGLLGHSDADVLLHAVADAVLGALALGDIGHWFPDNDPAFKDADSRKLLLAVLQDPRVAGWRLVNLDITVLAERPKIAPHATAIRHSLATLFGADIGQISVKATTLEKLGALGRAEGMATMAVILLEKP